jgi:hypothetical protein
MMPRPGQRSQKRAARRVVARQREKEKKVTEERAKQAELL